MNAALPRAARLNSAAVRAILDDRATMASVRAKNRGALALKRRRGQVVDISVLSSRERALLSPCSLLLPWRLYRDGERNIGDKALERWPDGENPGLLSDDVRGTNSCPERDGDFPERGESGTSSLFE